MPRTIQSELEIAEVMANTVTSWITDVVFRGKDRQMYQVERQMNA